MSDLLPRDTRLENNVQQEAALGRISVMLEKHTSVNSIVGNKNPELPLDEVI